MGVVVAFGSHPGVEAIPVDRFKGRVSQGSHPVNGCKIVVEEEVELRRDPFGARVENQGDGGGMIGRETQVFSLATAGVPFWELLPILQLRVQDVGWTSPGMEATEMMEVREPGPCPLLFWGHIVQAWKVIPDMDRMLEGEGPELQVVSGRPGEG